MSNGQKSRLGRGLASLIGEKAKLEEEKNSSVLDKIVNQDNYPSSPEVEAVDDEGDVPFNESPPLDKVEEYSLKHVGYPSEESRIIPLTDIRPSHLNPRKEFSQSELDDLAESIRERGLIQPIVVRPAADGSSFEIIAGERRWRAAQSIPLHEIPVIIKEISDQELLELAIIENVQRSDLNAIEEAFGYQELIDRHNYTQETLAHVVGKSRSYLANILRLVNLPTTVQELVREGELSAGHARALVNREDAEELAFIVIERGLSVRETEALVSEGGVQALQVDEDSGIEIITSQPVPVAPDVNVLALENELAGKLGLKVKIKPGRGESGELKLKYSSFEQFEAIRRLLAGEQ